MHTLRLLYPRVFQIRHEITCKCSVVAMLTQDYMLMQCCGYVAIVCLPRQVSKSCNLSSSNWNVGEDRKMLLRMANGAFSAYDMAQNTSHSSMIYLTVLRERVRWLKNCIPSSTLDSQNKGV